MGRPEENLHYWKLEAEENGCFEGPYPFPNDHARFLFYPAREALDLCADRKWILKRGCPRFDELMTRHFPRDGCRGVRKRTKRSVLRRRSRARCESGSV